MTPFDLLILTLILTLFAWGAIFFRHRRLSRRLQQLARQWHLHYSARDQLRLATRVAQAFPIPGVASLRVTDLVYGLVGDSHRYIFTAEYTVGALRAKHRVQRVASFSERKGDEAALLWPIVTLASADQTLLDQYRSLAPSNS